MRSAVKRGESGALKVLGFGKAAHVSVANIQIKPRRAEPGATVQITFEVSNSRSAAQNVLVDLGVHYVTANGQTRVKVFKLKTLELAPGQTATLAKKLSLTEMKTRKHYPWRHQVDVILNGQAQPLGAFELRAGG